MVLEARGRVGGLTYSPRSEVLGSRVDLGGQWVAPVHRRMSALIREYDVPLVKQYMSGQRACLHGDKVYFGPAGRSRASAKRRLADYHEAIGLLYAAMDGVSASEPWSGQEAARLDAMTFATWIETVARYGAGEGLFHTAARRLFRRAGARDLGARPALQAQDRRWPDLHVRHGTGGQSAHMMGSEIVSERMAAELDVHLRSPVRRVVQSGAGAIAYTDEASWRAPRVICALSPALVSQIAFTPPAAGISAPAAPAIPGTAGTRKPYRLDRPSGGSRRLSGNIIATDGSMTACYDLGDEVSERGILIMLLTGAPAYAVDRIAPEERRARVIELLEGARARGAGAARIHGPGLGAGGMVGRSLEPFHDARGAHHDRLRASRVLRPCPLGRGRTWRRNIEDTWKGRWRRVRPRRAGS